MLDTNLALFCCQEIELQHSNYYDRTLKLQASLERRTLQSTGKNQTSVTVEEGGWRNVNAAGTEGCSGSQNPLVLFFDRKLEKKMQPDVSVMSDTAASTWARKKTASALSPQVIKYAQQSRLMRKGSRIYQATIFLCSVAHFRHRPC